MEIWSIIGLPIAGIIYLIDFLLRRKKWKENTKGEKASLIVSMVSVVPHLILSALGILWGIVGNGSETRFGELLYDVTLQMAGIYVIVAVAALIGALILRKKGKIKASILINVIAIVYIVVVMLVNWFAGTFL